MQIKITYVVVTSQISVAIDEEGRHVETLLLPLPVDQEDFEELESYFDLDIEPEQYGAVPDLILPKGYFAIGVYVGKFLKRILLSGPGLSYVATSEREVHDEISANELRIRQQSSVPFGPR